MRRQLWAVLVVLSVTVLAGEKADVEAVKQTIQTSYVEGLQNEGNLAKIDQGFHPEFKLLGVNKDGSLWALPIADWKAKVKKRAAEGHYPKPADKKVSIKFLNVDVTGTAAMAKFEFYVGQQKRYVDYLSLYKIDGAWKIISKIYYQFPNEKS